MPPGLQNPATEGSTRVACHFSLPWPSRSGLRLLNGSTLVQLQPEAPFLRGIMAVHRPVKATGVGSTPTEGAKFSSVAQKQSRRPISGGPGCDCRRRRPAASAPHLSRWRFASGRPCGGTIFSCGIEVTAACLSSKQDATVQIRHAAPFSRFRGVRVVHSRLRSGRFEVQVLAEPPFPCGRERKAPMLASPKQAAFGWSKAASRHGFVNRSMSVRRRPGDPFLMLAVV